MGGDLATVLKGSKGPQCNTRWKGGKIRGEKQKARRPKGCERRRKSAVEGKKASVGQLRQES